MKKTDLHSLAYWLVYIPTAIQLCIRTFDLLDVYMGSIWLAGLGVAAIEGVLIWLVWTVTQRKFTSIQQRNVAFAGILLTLGFSATTQIIESQYRGLGIPVQIDAVLRIIAPLSTLASAVILIAYKIVGPANLQQEKDGDTALLLTSRRLPPARKPSSMAVRVLGPEQPGNEQDMADRLALLDLVKCNPDRPHKWYAEQVKRSRQWVSRQIATG